MKEVRDGNLGLSENAIKVLEKRYLKKDELDKVLERPADMFRRVAKNIAAADSYYGKNAEEVARTEESFYRMMTELEFLPNSPTLMNAGRDLQQLSACFVLPIEDSMEAIFETIKETAIIHKTGGGTGFSFSRLRAKNSRVRSTGGISSGPVSFMKVFNAATQAVKQGGCVTPETRVSTEFGIVRIKSLGPKDATAPNSWHPHNGRPFAVATDSGIEISDEFYNNGIEGVRKLKTSCGYSITATAEHRFRVIDEEGNYIWKHLKDIKTGDWVALQKDTYFAKGDYPLPKCSFNIHFNATAIKTPQMATEQLGEFAGFFVGDGTVSLNERDTGRSIFTINDNDKDTRDYLCKIADDLFGIRPVLQKKKQDKSTNYFFNSTVLVHWLKQIGIEKKGAMEAHVPEIVFRSGKVFACGFLRGLFSADGCVSKEGYISLASVSEKLIIDTQILLLSLGVPSRVSVERKRRGAFGKNPLFRLSVITKAGVGIFKKEIGFISEEKNGRLKDFSEKTWEFNDIIPHQENLLRKIYNGPGRGCGKNRSKKGANRPLYRDIQHYLSGISANRNLTRSRLEKLADKHEEVKNTPLVRWFLANSQFYDKVNRIEDGESLTLDISVPGNNTYIANGFVSHNTRRGANMGILRVDHPDILEFVACKENDKDITNFNISVAITEDFIKKVLAGEDYDLIDPRTKNTIQKLSAKKVFNMIIQMAWKNGEPGIIFIDRMNQYNPTPKLGPYESTNPCGEQVLLPYESCNLGSINLAKMVESGEINWKKLGETAKEAVHFLDNVIDMNSYPLKRIEEMTKSNRKIGLGVMGFADMLLMLGIAYGSEGSVRIAEKVMKFILDASQAASREIARLRGAFPNFKESVYNTAGDKPLRNATLTTIAPTGTLSIIANCSSGIEPVFAISYIRNIMDNTKLIEVHPYFKEVAERKGFFTPELMNIIAQKGSVKGLSEIPDEVQNIFVTAHDIDSVSHIMMQAAFQKWTNNAVSKTVNLPQDATVEDVRNIYMLAYESGCKGVTIYRDHSREEQVLSISSSKDTKQSTATKIIPRPRPNVTVGTTTKIATGCGNLYVTINEDENGFPFEVFMSMGKAGGCAMSQLEAMGRLLSLALRSGIDTNSIIEQLRGIRCPSPSWEKGGRIFSCSDAIARVLERIIVESKKTTPQVSANLGDVTNGTPVEGSVSTETRKQVKAKTENIVGVCPDCGNALWHVEGCMVCKSCGYSKCG